MNKKQTSILGSIIVAIVLLLAIGWKIHLLTRVYDTPESKSEVYFKSEYDADGNEIKAEL